MGFLSCAISFEKVADQCFKHLCQNNATCIEGHVNYTCACDSSGWSGTYCEKGRIWWRIAKSWHCYQLHTPLFFLPFVVLIDVDECVDNPTVCHINAVCLKTEGSYICSCKPGFQGDGKNNCKGERTFVNMRSVKWKCIFFLLHRFFSEKESYLSKLAARGILLIVLIVLIVPLIVNKLNR